MRTVTVIQTCPYCRKPSEIVVDADRYERWQEGKRRGESAAISGIQVIFPDLTADEREVLISGTHPECWDRLFPPEEEDEDG